METSAEQLSTEQILSAVSHLSLPELEQVFAGAFLRVLYAIGEHPPKPTNEVE